MSSLPNYIGSLYPQNKQDALGDSYNPFGKIYATNILLTNGLPGVNSMSPTTGSGNMDKLEIKPAPNKFYYNAEDLYLSGGNPGPYDNNTSYRGGNLFLRSGQNSYRYNGSTTYENNSALSINLQVSKVGSDHTAATSTGTYLYDYDTIATINNTGMLPGSNNKYDLGSSSNRWKKLYLTDLDISSNLTLSGSLTANGLTLRRTLSSSESVTHQVIDTGYNITCTNDEKVSDVIFDLNAKDTETGNGANPSVSQVRFTNASNKSTVTADFFSGNLNGLATRASQDASGNSIESTYLKRSGGELTGKIYRAGAGGTWITGRANAMIANTSSSTSNFVPTLSVKTINGSWQLGTLGDYLYISYITDADIASGADSTDHYKFSTNGAYTGSAAKLTSPRTIALGGDLSGSASFDGSANITISATIGTGNVTNAKLANSSIKIGSTSVSLGSTITNLDGMGSIKCTSVDATSYLAAGSDIADSVTVSDNMKLEYGRCYATDGINFFKTTKKCQKGTLGIHSDTAGSILGNESNKTQLKIALGGFVLAYVDKIYKTGTPLVSAPNGTLTKASLFDLVFRSNRIVGHFFMTPKNKIWHEVSTKNRYIIKI